MLEFLKTKTIKDTTIVTVGMVLSTLLSAASIFLLARFLGPGQFGLYVTVLAIAMIVIDSLELAISNSIVKFSSSQGPDTAGFIHYGFRLKLRLGFLVGAIFAGLSYLVADWIHPELKLPLVVSSLFIPAVFWLRFPRSLLRSRKRFMADSFLENVISLARLIAVGLFYWLGKLTVITALFGYLIGALVGGAVGALLIDWSFLKAGFSQKIKKRFFGFQKWLTLGFIVAAVHSRIDSVLLLKLVGPETTGIYQAAYRFFMPVTQLASVLSLVFAPRFASFPDLTTSRVYLFKAARLTLAIGSLSLMIIPLAAWLVQLIFGEGYLGAVLPTQILALGFFGFIAGAPWVAFLLYFAAKAKTFFYINLLQLLLIVGLNWWLTPRFQATGAALAAGLTLIITNGLIAAVSYRLLYAKQKN